MLIWVVGGNRLVDGKGSVRSDVVGGGGLVGDGGTMDGEETVGCNTLGSADGEQTPSLGCPEPP